MLSSNTSKNSAIKEAIEKDLLLDQEIDDLLEQFQKTLAEHPAWILAKSQESDNKGFITHEKVSYTSTAPQYSDNHIAGFAYELKHQPPCLITFTIHPKNKDSAQELARLLAATMLLAEQDPELPIQREFKIITNNKTTISFLCDKLGLLDKLFNQIKPFIQAQLANYTTISEKLPQWSLQKFIEKDNMGQLLNQRTVFKNITANDPLKRIELFYQVPTAFVLTLFANHAEDYEKLATLLASSRFAANLQLISDESKVILKNLESQRIVNCLTGLNFLQENLVDVKEFIENEYKAIKVAASSTSPSYRNTPRRQRR